MRLAAQEPEHFKKSRLPSRLFDGHQREALAQVEADVAAENGQNSGAGAILGPVLAWVGTQFSSLDQTGVYILLGIGVVGAVVLFARGELIARRAKALLAELDS